MVGSNNIYPNAAKTLQVMSLPFKGFGRKLRASKSFVVSIRDLLLCPVPGTKSSHEYSRARYQLPNFPPHSRIFCL